jgi:antitoxin component YwqK of YwqJK toxin-antitoxin module
MKRLIQISLIFLTLLSGAIYAQNHLPVCQGSNYRYWSNCIGTGIYGTSINSQNNEKYIGEYIDGRRHGQGTLYSSNGSIISQGIWVDGSFVRPASVQQSAAANSTIQSPIYVQSQLPACQGSTRDWSNCIGTSWSNGEKYVGEWRYGLYNGRGTLYSSNGSIINQGIWANDRFLREEKINTQPNLVLQNTCEPNLIIRFGDGNTGCMTDYEFFKFQFNGLPFGLQGYVKDSKSYSIATIKDLKMCPTTNIGWVKEDILSANNKIKAIANCTKFLIEGLQKNGLEASKCECDTLIDNGITKLSQKDFREKLDEYLTIRSANLKKNNADYIFIENERKKLEDEKLQLAEELKKLADEGQKTIPVPALAPLKLSNKRLALVIGNTAYKIRPLVNPRNDADDISRVLKSTGFDVIDLRDASLSQMRSATRQFGEKLMSNDVGLVYYSGHGIEVNGRNYLIPVNADIKHSDEVADQALDVSLILAKMDSAKKGVNILIVDACRDDPFGRSFRSSTRGLASMDAPQGTIIAYATAPGTVAADGVGRNSPYTKHLVRAMQMPNTPIELMFKEVRRSVREETKNTQTPWENTSLSGDFYFSVKK